MRSGRAFHRHLFVRVADPQKRERMIRWARRRGIDVRNPGPIRPPFAPHRLGLRVTLLQPNTVEAALEALAPSPNRHRVSLSGRMFALLRYGDRDGRYRSRSEVVQALAQAAVNAGFPESWLLRVLLDPKNLGGQKVAEIAARNGENAARRYVTLSYRKALQRAAHSPAFRNGSDALTAISEIAQAADARHFPGRGGATALAVLHAHIAIARRVRGVRYGASVRELAEIAGLSSIATVSAANRRLEQAGFLVHLDKSWGGGSTRYLLKLPRSVTNPNNHTSGGVRSIVRVGYDPGKDAWRWRALGKSAWRVWRVLDGRTVGELSALVGVGRSAIRKHLRSLGAWGLAARDGGKRWHSVHCDLDAIAQKLGSAGARKRQRERHQQERKLMTAMFAMGARGSDRLARRERALVLIRQDCKKGGPSSAPATETRTVEANELKTVVPEAASVCPRSSSKSHASNREARRRWPAEKVSRTMSRKLCTHGVRLRSWAIPRLPD